MWNAEDLRTSYLSFFEQRGHKIVPSSSLIPDKDPTLLFTTAGMVQFKPFYSGEVPLPYKRAASCQKCLRATDLENVGHTIRHHTFFEMLGNFSFGDYFKKEAIEWGYEFITKILNLDIKKLYFSVFKEDEESYNIWKKLGVPENRILKLGKETNFWGPAGKTGACGPSTEIYYDLGENYGCKKPDCAPGCDCDRYLEIWNLVFPQYDMQEDGSLKPLKNRGVDTGMGLERVLMILQDKESPYTTELFEKPMKVLEKILNRSYHKNKIIFRTILDHTRALTFAIGDGVYPSNEGRGYVLKRILRRALRYAYKLNIKEPFMYTLVPYFSDIYKQRYSEIKEKREEISIVIKEEEEKFLNTISKNMWFIEKAIDEAKQKKEKIKGDVLFKLYDTYGIPVDFVEEIAKEKKVAIDIKGFEKELEKQRERSKEKEKFEEEKKNWNILGKEKETEFVGYIDYECETEIIKWRKRKDGKIEVVLEKTPFYAEAGGQVGDKGTIKGRDFHIEVIDTKWLLNQIVHIGKLKGEIKDKKVIAKIDVERRKEIMRAHTATHLLHKTLRDILGERVKQEGSLVEPGRLRFDFTYPRPLDKMTITEIEEKINSIIIDNRKVKWEYKKFEEAIKEKALAFFGEKYGDIVRVVEVENYSKELCGGTHCNATGEIGFFKIVKEEAISAGVRRIEAYTGKKAFYFTKEMEEKLEKVAESLNVSTFEIDKKIEKFIKELKEKERNIESLKQKIAEFISENLQIREKNGIKYILSYIPSLDPDTVRFISDKIWKKHKDIILTMIVTDYDGKVFYFCKTEKNSGFNANEIVKNFAKYVKGGGGGSPQKAEGGGKEKGGIKEGLKSIEDMI